MQNQGHIVGLERRSKVVRSCKPTSYDLPLDATILPLGLRGCLFLGWEKVFCCNLVLFLQALLAIWWDIHHRYINSLSRRRHLMGTEFQSYSLFNLMCGSLIANLTCHLNQCSNFNRYKKQNKNPVMEKLTILIGLGDLHLSVAYEYDNNLFDV